ncbi:sulfite reductase subunit alpha [Roseateles asaccharophilus]|uniref:NADPH--hemoprotein reductase n=1 Tax=Roseateles asaccharophilus TaxID=582607 RepID=A0ABU2A8L5_9BURK|nr:sulfite reductase subunit alpha [Roseateles asaccharophilus]MDR7333335.1 sulfite reductase (NADPH) flavoprotein alpha-component [Roseateles asaccharophilus]
MITDRLPLAIALIALYLLLCAFVTWRFRRKLRLQAEAAAQLLPAMAGAGAPPMWVLHASQTGQAEDLALQTARALHVAGQPVRLAALGSIRPDELRGATHALFVVSTYGEGDPPDAATPFWRAALEAAPDLKGLNFGVLALGDRTYDHFCGFGRELDAWLQQAGANALFERIDVDRCDAAALEHWRHQLGHIAGTADMPAWEEAHFDPWQLAAREHLNPGSAGGGVFHIELLPPAGQALPDWQAGDLVQVQHASEPGRPREYTVASLPADGRVHLMVRQTQRDDGSLGLASGWLTAQSQVGDTIALRVRSHAAFRIGENAARPLILIGNGTGLAGLRAHLKARAVAGAPPAWLVYGERQAAHDAHYDGELQAWAAQGLLARLDRVYSRDQAQQRYVQHLLAEQAHTLREWLAKDAAIYVCGSLQGMATAVDEVLRETLGEAQIDHLIEQGRYRRDVY